MILVALAFVVGVAATGYALRPELAGAPTMYTVLAGAYGLLSVVALIVLHRDGTLRQRLMPRWGDASIGLLSAGFLIFGAWVTGTYVTPPDSERSGWVFRILLQMGGPDAIRASVALSVATLAIASFEELTWRGLVLFLLEERLGTRRAWLATAAIYAATMLPTAYTLRDPNVGYNPMLFVAALGGGLVWSFIASRTGRLAPVLLSHMVFTYFSPVVLAG